MGSLFCISVFWRVLAVENSVVLRFGRLVAADVIHRGRQVLIPLNENGVICLILSIKAFLFLRF